MYTNPSSSISGPGFGPMSRPGFGPTSRPGFDPMSDPLFGPSRRPGFDPMSGPLFGPSRRPGFDPILDKLRGGASRLPEFAPNKVKSSKPSSKEVKPSKPKCEQSEVFDKARGINAMRNSELLLAVTPASIQDAKDACGENGVSTYNNSTTTGGGVGPGGIGGGRETNESFTCNPPRNANETLKIARLGSLRL